MESLFLLAAAFIFVVFPLTALLLAVRNWLSGPPSIRNYIRYMNRQQQKDLQALNVANLDYEERRLAEKAIRSKYIRQLAQLYLNDGDGY